MADSGLDNFDKLLRAVQHMQKCLECRICLHTVSSPVKTRCGHWFCRGCIRKVLDKKKASCPLCKTSLKRRSTTNDEHMQHCVDRFQKLVSAIQADSGIDILSLSTKHYHTKESSSSDVSHYNEPNSAQNVPPSRKSSSSNVGLQSENNSSNRHPLKNKRASCGTDENIRERSKTGRRNSETSGTTKDLFQYGFAGATTHITDDSNNSETRVVTADKVQSWLKTIPPCELLADTNRCSPIQQAACPSDDVIIAAGLETYSNSTDSDTERTDSRRNTDIRRQGAANDDTDEKRASDTLKRQSSETPSQRENNGTDRDKGRKSREAVETKGADSTCADLKFSAVHARVRAKDAKNQQRAGTSKAMNFGDNEPVKGINSAALLEETWSQGQSGDAQKVTPANMIPSAEKNWSSVVKFGKEMRTKKRKKLKCLNVSIENVNKSRLPGEILEEGNVGPRLIKDIKQETPNNRKGGDCDMSESPANTRTANNRRPVENEGLPNIESTRAKAQNTPRSCEGETSPKNRSNVSMSEGSQRAAESSFITLNEGEEIRIHSLNSQQMKDIIGVSGERKAGQGTPSKNLSPSNRECGKNPLALKRRDEPSKTLSLPSHSTPVKSGLGVTDDKTSPCLSYNREVHRIRDVSELLGSTVSESPSPSKTPNLGRLSLRKKEKDTSPRISSYPNSSNFSCVTTIKRNLIEQICQNKVDITGDNVSRPSSKVPEQQQGFVKHSPANAPHASKYFCAGQNNAPKRIEESKSFVAFKKLGRVVKQRKNIVKFFYLGSTRRSQLTNTLGCTYISTLQKPCNPVEAQTAQHFEQISTVENSVHDNVEITPIDQLIPADIVISNQWSSNAAHNVTQDKPTTSTETPRVARELINPVEPESSFDAATSTTRFDMYKTNASERHSSPGGTSINKSRHSPDALSLTVCEENEALAESEVTHSEHCAASTRAATLNDIRMLSPEKDSQLKFLSTESPLSESLRPPKFMQRAEASRDGSSKKSNFSDVKGAHSRALIRGSQGATSESAEADTSRTFSRKRKRADTRDGLSHTSKKSDELCADNNDSDSDTSFSSRVTQVRKRDASANDAVQLKKEDDEVQALMVKLNERQPIAQPVDVQNAGDSDAVVLSSDTDIIDDGEEDFPNKTYKRVVPVQLSDTDSSESVHVRKRIGNKSKNPVNEDDTESSGPQIPKRKRPLETESDDDIDVHEIVHSWCNTINPQERNSKKGRLETIYVVNSMETNANKCNPFTNSPILMKSYDEKNTSSLDKDLFESDPMFSKDIMDPISADGHEVKSKGTAVNCEDDVNSIIDKVRAIQRSQTSDTENKTPDNRELQKIRDACLMQDNFDEIIANVDTQLIMNGYLQSEEIIPPSVECRNSHAASVKQLAKKVPNKTSMPTVITDTDKYTLLTYNSSSSDKENNATPPKCGKQYESENLANSMDRTLTPEYHKNVSDKGSARSTSSRRNVSLEKVKSHETVECKMELGRQTSGTSKGSSAHNLSSHGCLDFEEDLSDKTIVDVDPDSHETVGDQDSLMNVTQHQLLLKQFEEDLFGISKCRDRIEASANNASLQEDQRTPRKEKGRDSKYPHTRRKDTEHSGGEDDIVENTPDTKTKNSGNSVQSINSSVRRNLTTSDTTPGSKNNEIPSVTTASPLTERSSNSTICTPTSTRSIYPLYQSTPNVQRNATQGGNAGTATCTGNRKPGRVSNASILCGKQVKDDTAGIVQQQQKQQPDRRKLCFVCSGLVPAHIERVKELAATYNAKYMNQFTREVTHVIVKTSEDNNTANKTLKYLQGIAHRKWIVGYKWVIDSLREKKLLNEEPYEVLDSVTLEAGPRNSRLREKGLFEDFVFLCYGPYVDVSVEQYKDLLLSTGATVVETLEELAAEKRKLKAIIIQADIHDNKIIKDWYKKTGAVPIVHDWVVECISQYKLISLYPYLQELLAQDVLALGYPEFLVEEEVDADGDSTYELYVDNKI